MSDFRAAIRTKWGDPAERVRYIRHRLRKRESTPGVSWDSGDHEDVVWLCAVVEIAADVPEPVFCAAYQDWQCAWCEGAGDEVTSVAHEPRCPWMVLKQRLLDVAPS